MPRSSTKKKIARQRKARHDAVSKELFVALPQDRDAALLITWYTMQMEDFQKQLVEKLHQNIHDRINWLEDLPSYVLRGYEDIWRNAQAGEKVIWRWRRINTPQEYYSNVKEYIKQINKLLTSVCPHDTAPEEFKTDELDQ